MHLFFLGYNDIELSLLDSSASLQNGHDFWAKSIVDWERVKQLHRQQATQNNEKENRHRIEHDFKVGDLVLVVTLPDE